MAFLMLLHEKMRLQRKINKLTLRELRLSSRKERITKNISKVQKMYSNKIAMIQKQAKMGASQFKSGIMQSMGIGTQGLNPMGFGNMGGMSLFSMGQFDSLAAAFNQKCKGINGNGAALVQGFLQGNYQQNKDKDGNLVTGEEWIVGGVKINKDDYAKLQQGAYQIQQMEQMQRYQAQQMASMYETKCSVWEEAAIAELEAEQDEALAPLEMEETEMDLERESCEAQLADAKARLDGIKQALSEGIKDSAPTFGLG